MVDAVGHLYVYVFSVTFNVYFILIYFSSVATI